MKMLKSIKNKNKTWKIHRYTTTKANDDITTQDAKKRKYNINDPNEVFNEGLSKERMITIAKLLMKQK